MDDRNLESITKHLQDEKVQQQIRKNIAKGRSEATVRIGWAAQLFDFKDSQLREWENRGLLNPSRSKDTATGQRQYSLEELDKLAIIRELIDAKFSPGEIPPNIDELWKAIEAQSNHKPVVKANEPEIEPKYIDQRIQYSYYNEAFWRYYVSHVLRLALLLICEDTSFTRAGLILLLKRNEPLSSELSTERLPTQGEALVGWMGQSRTFYTFLTQHPAFEYHTDFRLFRLMTTEEDLPKDTTLIAVPRMEADARSLTLTDQVVETVRCLLEPLYKEVPDWRLYLGHGMRDILDPLVDFKGSTNLSDTILTGFAQLVVSLGGKRTDGEDKWHFCCVMVPNNPHLPFQQRSLILRARSKLAPREYKIGTMIVSPDAPIMSVSLRAYQGGYIVYRPTVTPQDTSIVHLSLEEPIGSAIAVPVGGEEGLPLAVLYIVANEANAFSEQDMYLLRMVGRMLEELLLMYQARTQVAQKPSSMFTNPSVIDLAFAAFASENDFVSDLEELLRQIRDIKVEPITDIEDHYTTEEGVSLIAIDINNATSLANKFGDQMAKNLSWEVGLTIQKRQEALFTKPSDHKLYHIYADRYYLLLNKVSLDNAREKAELLRQALNGTYEVDAVRSASEQLPSLESMLVSSDITVRLGVGSYTYAKLQEVLKRYPQTSLASTAALLARALDGMLNAGQDEGGSVIFSWDPKVWGYMPWSPSED